MNPYWTLIKQFWPLIVAVILGGLIAWFGHSRHEAGKREVQQKWDDSVQRGKVIVNQLKIGQRAITTVTETVYKDRIKVIHDKGDTILKQVPVFVRNDADLGGGFRLLYDAAAANTVPDSAAIPNAAPTSAIDVATITAKNYTTYYKVSQQLVSLQDWLAAQYATYLEKCKQRDVHCSVRN